MKSEAMSTNRHEDYLLVEQTVYDEEEGALLRVEEDEENTEEKVGLIQAQNPRTAQNDKLGQDFKHNQPGKTT